MITRRTHKTWLAAALALALVATACGDDGGPERDQASENANGTPEASENGSATPAEAVDVKIDEVALQALLDNWRTRVGSFGATLSIRVPGHDDIHLVSGVDDRDPETPMPTDGTYAAASVVKTFVAATALQLVAEGRLSLDEPVEPWLPELPNADEITLAMLLGHTAGLGEWNETATILEDLTRSFTPEEVLAEHVAAPPLGEPGERFAYTNADYTAVGVLIERELHDDLAAVIAERFTGPLSLDDTVLSDGSTKPTRHGWFSLPDAPDPDRPLDNLDFPHEAQMTTLWAAGNLTSSSSDLLDWGEALYSGDVLGADSTATMLEMRRSFTLDGVSDRLVATDAPTPLHYGLGAMGFCLDQAGCSPDEVEVVGHSGGLGAGTRVLLAHHPDSGATLVFHANVGDIGLPTLIAPLAGVFGQLGLT
jgi:D-alanyl-D-alanine carboxypeptidase